MSDHTIPEELRQHLNDDVVEAVQMLMDENDVDAWEVVNRGSIIYGAVFSLIAQRGRVFVLMPGAEDLAEVHFITNPFSDVDVQRIVDEELGDDAES